MNLKIPEQVATLEKPRSLDLEVRKGKRIIHRMIREWQIIRRNLSAWWIHRRQA